MDSRSPSGYLSTPTSRVVERVGYDRQPIGESLLLEGLALGTRMAFVAWGLMVLAGVSGGSAESAEEMPLVQRHGLLTIYLDEPAGKVWLQVPESPAGDSRDLGSYLYVEGLTSGLGSNPVGLDRGQLGESHVLSLRRIGDRVLFVQPNLRFRADSKSSEERAAVEQSFASSVLWVGTIDRQRLSGVELLDLTPFLVRDAHNSAMRLQVSGEGSFELDTERSVVDLAACLAFPDNLEFEALLSFTSEEPGPLVRETAANAHSLTLVQHHSLIRLPDDRYRPRAFDPRTASFAIRFADYAAALREDVERRWIVRHRLEKKDPGADRSAAVEPIVYYVDRAIPEPIRSAVVDGVGWWARAFEATGFDDAFRVELLPEGAHPLDVRYNVVQWVHRSTRGWSYGGGVVDPRTGEMLKGHVSLGSLRVRQDRLLFEGLAGTAKTGTGEPDDPLEMALARIRQLAAHEVGHTLGLAHNFAASTFAGRASVMDYPAPLVRITDRGELDFSDAYGVGVGVWDIHTIRYAYSHFPPQADESLELERMIQEGFEDGLIYLTDEDARPAGAAQPLASLWDNGQDPVDRLEVELRVRRIALDRFGQENVLAGTPLAKLEEVLVPLYLHHRYQLAAAVKVLGGLDYRYALRGDGQPSARLLEPERQKKALQVVLRTLDPAELDLPDRVLELLLPRPAGFERHREMFQGEMTPVFDPLTVAASSADATLKALLQPQRAARMVDFHRRDARQPDFAEVLEGIRQAVFESPPESDRHRAVRRRVQAVVVANLIELASNPRATPAVQARAEASLQEIRGSLGEDAEASHLSGSIRRFLERVGPSGEQPAQAPPLPPGDPIGGSDGIIGWSACSW